MEQRVSLITLGVKDLAASRAFYLDGLGWQESVPPSNEHVCFIQMNGVVFGLYPLDALAKETGLPPTENTTSGPGFRGTALAYNTRSKDDVAGVLAEAEAAGGTIVKAAEEVFWGGYSGYFADPDGHLWEVAWNPFATVDDAGNFLIQT